MLAFGTNRCFLRLITRSQQITGNRRFSFHDNGCWLIFEALKKMTEKGSILDIVCIQWKIIMRNNRERRRVSMVLILVEYGEISEWIDTPIIYQIAMFYLKLITIERVLINFLRFLDNYSILYHLPFFLFPCNCGFQVIILFQVLSNPSSMPLKLDVYYDFTCPWCYVGFLRCHEVDLFSNINS